MPMESLEPRNQASMTQSLESQKRLKLRPKEAEAEATAAKEEEESITALSNNQFTTKPQS